METLKFQIVELWLLTGKHLEVDLKGNSNLVTIRDNENTPIVKDAPIVFASKILANAIDNKVTSLSEF